MNDKGKIEFFKGLYGDYQISDDDVVKILELGEWKGFTRKNLLGRLLKYRRWYEIREVLTPELLREALSDDVLKTLFPRSLAQKYDYVRKILYQ